LNKEDFLVRHLPGLAGEAGFTQYAGYLPVDPQNHGHMFFWLCESRSAAATDPLVIWLNGGTGTSSLVGLFLENGPFRVEPDLRLGRRELSWNAQANVLYIDQPLGAGYSWVDPAGDVDSDAQITIEFYEFLLRFFEVFPEHRHDLYITGESFAGHYIPRIARYILEQNRLGAAAPIPLVGLAIGDGWVEPEIHYGAYADCAYANGLIDGRQRRAVQRIDRACRLGFAAHPEQGDAACDEILPAILHLAGTTVERPGGPVLLVPNIYDIRLSAPYSPIMVVPNYPRGENLLPLYLNQPDVRAALHAAGPKPWVSLDMGLVERLQSTVNQSSRHLYATLAEELRLLFYSGLCDLMINHVGTTRFLDSLKWSGHQAYARARQAAWQVDEGIGGYAREASRLAYVMIPNAGHMVPYDQPRIAQALIDTFLSGRPFVTPPR
jgi:carboxypeptidase D